NGSLLKLGLVRVKLIPAHDQSGDSFKQELILASGSIQVVTPSASYSIAVDANDPEIGIAIDCPAADVEVSLENWRQQPYRIQTQTSDLFKSLAGKNTDPHPTI